MKPIIKLTFPNLLAILCILGGGYHLYREVIHLNLEVFSSDMVTEWEEHIKLIRERIPRNILIVGYLELTDIFPTDNYDSSEFVMTQYGMAPVVLLKGYEFEWIIGNFGGQISQQTIRDWLDQRLEEYTMEDLGFGIYLIHGSGN